MSFAVHTEYRTETHIDDIASAFILLVEEALKPNGGAAQWGQDGYYFVAGAQFVSVQELEVSGRMADE